MGSGRAVFEIEYPAARNSAPAGSSPLLPRDWSAWLVIAAALAALGAKLYCAWTTFGTNDVETFAGFARTVEAGGIMAGYHLGSVFNHPPLVGHALVWISKLTQATGAPFPFLLRLPGIVADFASVLLVVWHVRRHGERVRLWAMLLFALSPVSFMVTGFHGNTDALVVLGLLAAVIASRAERPTLSGFFLALSLHVKVIGVIIAPVLFFHWLHRRRALVFTLTCALVCIAGWVEPLTQEPLLFLRNVFGYSSEWGVWGISYWLRLTGIPALNTHYLAPSLLQAIAANIFKLITFTAILAFAWRRRTLAAEALFPTVAAVWAIFFALAPGAGAQYFIWPAPFLLLCSSRWYLAVTAASALFLFFFYNTICGGMPWYRGESTRELVPLWSPWNVWPWAAFAAGLVWFLKKERAATQAAENHRGHAEAWNQPPRHHGS